MRQVDERIRDAIRYGYVYRQGGSLVVTYNWRSPNRKMRLSYNNNIIVSEDLNNIRISTCGWHTPTTLRKLNLIPGVYVAKRKGVLYLNDKEWDGKEIRVSKHELMEFRGQLPHQR